MFYLRRVVVFVVFNLTGLIAFVNAQEILELKDKKKEIEKEIETISTLIQKTDNESTNSLSNIKLTKRKIDLKNNLIRQIDSESEHLKNQISYRKEKIDSLSKQVSIIKNDYKKLLVYTQKTKNKNIFLLLLFSSADLNQAYKRIKFYQQILRYKSQIAIRYEYAINSIKNENDKLKDNISTLSKRQNEKTNELNELKKEENRFKQKVKTLSKKKKELLAELEDQKKITKKINDEINRLIAEEAKRNTEIKKSTNKSAQLALSNNFKENIGRFELPVKNGVITGNYGESFHPVLKEIKVKNNGIDITFSQKSEVYSIYKGEVRTIFKIPGSFLAVIIRHGGYLSVYANLTTVNVSVGQEINSNQKIGEINLQKGEATAILHFELWNENKTEDPTKWFRIN